MSHARVVLGCIMSLKEECLLVLSAVCVNNSVLRCMIQQLLLLRELMCEQRHINQLFPLDSVHVKLQKLTMIPFVLF